MDPIAIVFMLIAIVVVWGGMAASLVHLVKNPDHLSGEEGATDPS
ncbi:methionine/alanine import family NSS transporter small subunit [Citricoccus nitrophenolicus]|uniref:Methionine/alanine import family NSS transporter small subunit n=1 Tax=Citricoccus nitrophenolicus TaxID=863575 RepID=A0ABV0IKC6_9MICC|nr:methionine/alanine import family NSS transporter small subunit [Citricoccus sp. I39-566]WMY78311.1 methionine/alanine import family NSS transporter small subunit [Citricoccus sp. I39-566]